MALQREQIVFIGTSDLSGHFRGKSFPLTELTARLERGVGYAPSNLFLSAFGPIQATPFGTRGEVLLFGDSTTRVCVPFEGGASEYFLIADLKTWEGAPWAFCPRQVLRHALERLRAETGLQLLATFEQEFTYTGVTAEPWQPYQLSAYRRQGVFGEMLVAALRQAGLVPDSFLAEYGAQQFEVTVAPTLGLRAADEAVITRELVQAVAYRLGQRASFTPLPTLGGVTNGTHVHFSFVNAEGEPVVHEPTDPRGLSLFGQQFVAGILHHLPSLCAVTAASVPSYYRLRPNGWAPSRADVGTLDRGTALRLCPGSASDARQRQRQFNVEFRVADAAANPYLVLTMLVQAGLDGVRNDRRIDGREDRDDAAPLPQSLSEALDLLEANAATAEWLGTELLAGYVMFKRAEIDSLGQLTEADICLRYGEAY